MDNGFKDLPSIKTIDLSGNSMTSFDNAFEELPNAVEGRPAAEIILRDNMKLTKLDASIKDLISKGGPINSDNIPLDCGCDMKWLSKEPGIVELFSKLC